MFVPRTRVSTLVTKTLVCLRSSRVGAVPFAFYFDKFSKFSNICARITLQLRRIPLPLDDTRWENLYSRQVGDCFMRSDHEGVRSTERGIAGDRSLNFPVGTNELVRV